MQLLNRNIFIRSFASVSRCFAVTNVLYIRVLATEPLKQLKEGMQKEIIGKTILIGTRSCSQRNSNVCTFVNIL